MPGLPISGHHSRASGKWSRSGLPVSGNTARVDKIFLIIDGYNVLHSCGMTGRTAGPGSLERARQELLAALKRHLPSPQRRRTTVVFDSQEINLPPVMTEADILIEFAVDHPSADERIIELVRQHSAPGQLLVVSSDHRIQRVALARRCRTIDSEIWMDQLREPRSGEPARATPGGLEKPVATDVDVDYWLQQLELNSEADPVDSRPDAVSDSPAGRTGHRAGSPEPLEDTGIFPPGYADDLFEDDQETP